MRPALTVSMQYAKKKECSHLLALLGEESLAACQKRNEAEKSVGVSWVGSYIVTLESWHGDLLARVTAALPPEFEEEVERRMYSAAMRKSGHYHLSSRLLGGFVLAEITVYGAPPVGEPAFRRELEAMCDMLEAVCHVSKEVCG